MSLAGSTIKLLLRVSAGFLACRWYRKVSASTNGGQMSRLERSDYVRAVLSSCGDASFEPVHVQKLFFLLDDRLAESLGGTYFDFQPYDYGPFDAGVYDSLQNLSLGRDVQLDQDWRGMRLYTLTRAGAEKGQRDLATLPAAVQNEIRKYAEWVRSQSFASLVSAIYKAYPAMKVNSVFVEPAKETP